MFYTCHVKEVVYHRGEQLRIRKSLKLYIVSYRNTMKNIKISLNKIWYTYTALIPKNMMLSLLNKCKFWFKCVSWTNDKKNWGRMHGLSLNVLRLPTTPRIRTLSGPDVSCWTWDQRHHREHNFCFLPRFTTVDLEGWSTSHFHLRQTRWFQFPHHKLSVPE